MIDEYIKNLPQTAKGQVELKIKEEEYAIERLKAAEKAIEYGLRLEASIRKILEVFSNGGSSIVNIDNETDVDYSFKYSFGGSKAHLG